MAGDGALPPTPPPTFFGAFVLFRARGSRAGRGEGRAALPPPAAGQPGGRPATSRGRGAAAPPGVGAGPRGHRPPRPAPPRPPVAPPLLPTPQRRGRVEPPRISPRPPPRGRYRSPPRAGAYLERSPGPAGLRQPGGAAGSAGRRDGGTEGGGPGWRRSGEADSQLLPGERGRRCGARHSRLPGGGRGGGGGRAGPGRGRRGRGRRGKGSGAAGGGRTGPGAAGGAEPRLEEHIVEGREGPSPGGDNVQGREPAGERENARPGHRTDPPGGPLPARASSAPARPGGLQPIRGPSARHSTGGCRPSRPGSGTLCPPGSVRPRELRPRVVNHLTASEEEREEDGSGRSKARGENWASLTTTFQSPVWSWSQRLKCKYESPGGLPLEVNGWEASRL
ncbi:uncharacterized protein [Taeniopygia guttata]|uniref:uncharacterized protein n=1 Tax=Taeniopygia guttata TaxID=59729 RepID=UPI003BB8AD66